MERLLAKADDYLRMRETQFEAVPVESLVRFGRPAPEILVEAETFGADLITMTRPEGRWLKRGLFGGVAAQVFRQSRVPVLLYRGLGEWRSRRLSNLRSLGGWSSSPGAGCPT